MKMDRGLLALLALQHIALPVHAFFNSKNREANWKEVSVTNQHASEPADVATNSATRGKVCSDGACESDSSQKDAQEKGKENGSLSSQCRVFLAESSIPGAGWGIYSGVDVPSGKQVGPVSVGIQVIDPVDTDWALYDSYWDPILTWSSFLADTVQLIFPGIGLLANSFPNLDNANPRGCENREPIFDVESEESTVNKYPAGVWSDCQNASYVALRHIPAGHEILVDYGDNWFLTRSDLPDDLVPLEEHYLEADDLLLHWEGDVSGDLDSDVAKAAYDDLRESADSVVKSLLPENHADAIDIVYGFVGKSPMSTAHKAVGLDRLVRPLEWFSQYGACMDGINIKKVSNINRAFAQSLFRENEVVSAVPVLHLSSHQMKTDRKLDQMLINYCYGHRDSTLLLLPMNPVVPLIRHSAKSPNVALRWWSAPDGPPHSNEEWKHLKVQQILLEDGGHLLLELYALRDLEADEELLLDFGAQWQEKWDAYVQLRTPMPETNITAWHYDHADEIFTELEPELYPPEEFIQVRCFVERENLIPPEDPTNNFWYEWRPTTTKTDTVVDTEPCRVLSANLKDFKKHTYRVILRKDGLHVTKVPWHAITFIPQPYTGASFVDGAFRHPIELPDAIFPEQWRDLNPVTQSATISQKEPTEEWDPSTCGLYLAPSAIPNSGLGMFTARALEPKERIFHGDIVCNIEDFELNMELRSKYLRREGPYDTSWLLQSYQWEASAGMAIFEADDTSSIIPGLGMLANSHPGLINAKQIYPDRVMDMKRSESSGAGASTTFHDVHFLAEGRIEAGAEIFVRYGDNWFKTRTDTLGAIPLSRDWRKSDELVGKFYDAFDGNMESKEARAAYDVVRLALKKDERLLNAVPEDVDLISTASEIGSAKTALPGRVKSRAWLNNNGVCLDNIRPGMSTLMDAGRGAFATRKLSNGSVIAPLPVVQLQRRHMEVYDTENRVVGDEEEEVVTYLGDQLLINYCYGHPESTILLFPYSPVSNYMNHNQTLKNAELRWSEHPSHRTDWLERTPADLEREDHSGMMMEVVALRDIDEGEEIFIDYGDEWEEAWQEHVRDWTPPSEPYVSAAERNALNAPLPTSDQIEDDPFYRSVVFGCFVTEFPDDDDIDADTDVAPTIDWKPPKGTLHGDDVYECTILERSVGGDKYKVQFENNDRTWIVGGVPRTAIQYFDGVYKSDMFLRSAFRHALGLPNQMLPDAWRDRPHGHVGKKASKKFV